MKSQLRMDADVEPTTTQLCVSLGSAKHHVTAPNFDFADWSNKQTQELIINLLPQTSKQELQSELIKTHMIHIQQNNTSIYWGIKRSAVKFCSTEFDDTGLKC